MTFTKNPDYWDTTRPALPDRHEMTFYEKEQAAVLGMQGDEVDVLSQFSATSGKALLTDPNVSVIELRAAQHRQVHMRTDKEPFNDKRVRQAVALLIDRDNVVEGLLEGKADYGNDSPFAPVYKTTDKSVPQRKQDVEQAKALLAEAGKERLQRRAAHVAGLRDPAVRRADPERPQGGGDRRQAEHHGRRHLLRRRGVRQVALAGLHVRHHRLRAPRRANVFLGAPLKSDGVWNAAHFKNKEYDGLVAEYVAALDLQSQRTAAKKIQEMLLDEVPIIFSYFYFYLSALKPTVAGSTFGDGPRRPHPGGRRRPERGSTVAERSPPSPASSPSASPSA